MYNIRTFLPLSWIKATLPASFTWLPWATPLLFAYLRYHATWLPGIHGSSLPVPFDISYCPLSNGHMSTCILILLYCFPKSLAAWLFRYMDTWQSWLPRDFGTWLPCSLASLATCLRHCGHKEEIPRAPAQAPQHYPEKEGKDPGLCHPCNGLHLYSLQRAFTVQQWGVEI